jgi:hypothetical protein
MQVDPGKSWEPPIIVNGNPVFKGSFQNLHGLKGAFQSLAAVDLGEESNAEVLMDPSHPSGMHAEECVCVFVCLYVYMYINIYVHIYVYVYIYVDVCWRMLAYAGVC